MQNWNEAIFFISYVFFAFVMGSIFGSFFNCVAGRISIGEKWWKGKSKCDGCGHELCALDLIPIISYCIQKGKCRYCGMKLSLQYPLSEVLLGCIFMIYVAVHKSFNFNMIFDLGLICVLFGISLCDFLTYEIPNGFLVVGILWWLLFQWINRISWFQILGEGIAALIISGMVLLLSFCMDKILKKETMGGGDIKLFFLVGLRLGLLGSVLNLVLSCLIGLVSICMMKKEKIPFGPAIAIATYIMLLAGDQLLLFYTNLFL